MIGKLQIFILFCKFHNSILLSLAAAIILLLDRAMLKIKHPVWREYDNYFNSISYILIVLSSLAVIKDFSSDCKIKSKIYPVWISPVYY